MKADAVSDAVSQSLAQTPASTPLYLGFSGGLDSRVLLHALVQQRDPGTVCALHINHHLHQNAAHWQRQCQQVAQDLGCRFVGCEVQPELRGQGVEAAARQARYQAFDAQVPEGGVLWLAHHLDDQLETLMLRLLRGSGLDGLASMEKQRAQAHYQLVRPLLEVPREQLLRYGQTHGLTWVEDDSNQNLDYDRNFLRHQVFPLLEQRWPSYRQTLERSRRLLAETAAEQSDYWTALILERQVAPNGLRLDGLEDWPGRAITRLLHHWLHHLNVPVPSALLLQHLHRDVIAARPDASPEVRIGRGCVRRYQGILYWIIEPQSPPEAPMVVIGQWQNWPGVGHLRLSTSDEGHNRLQHDLPDLHWQLRQGGERIWPQQRPARRDLKRLLAEYQIPPWQRSRLPLLYSGNRLVAVADLCVERSLAAQEGEPGLKIDWNVSVSD